MQYAEIPGNSSREFYDGKFPGIPEREFPVALLELRAVVRVRESETPAYLGVSDVFIYLIKTQRAIWPLTCFKNIQSISYS